MYSTGIMVERAYRVRLKLSGEQVHMLHRLFGASRHVWNWALELRTTAYRGRNEKLNWVGLSKLFTVYRVAPGTEWLSTLPREPFNQVLRDQEKAFSNFFAKRAKYPRFRRRGQHDAVRFTLDQRRAQGTSAQVDRTAGTVQLPGLGIVKFKNTYGAMPGRLRSVTLSRDAAGRYFASFTADRVVAPEVKAPTESAVGIDLGLGKLAVLSTGERLDASKALAKKLARLRRYQRRATRQRNVALRTLGLDPAKPIPKGTRIPTSNRAWRIRQRIGRLHAKVADLRREHSHQVSHALTTRFKLIALEDLNVKAMGWSMRHRAFRRAVADASLGELRRQIEYKAQWRGRTVVAVDRFYPSSKTCSDCRAVNADLTLGERRWVCAACGTDHDRDLNAAKNILTEGLRLHVKATPGSGESGGAHATHARGETPVRGGTLVPLTRPDSTNREPVKRRAAPSSRRSRRERTRAERRTAGT